MCLLALRFGPVGSILGFRVWGFGLGPRVCSNRDGFFSVCHKPNLPV